MCLIAQFNYTISLQTSKVSLDSIVKVKCKITYTSILTRKALKYIRKMLDSTGSISIHFSSTLTRKSKLILIYLNMYSLEEYLDKEWHNFNLLILFIGI